MPRQSPRRPRHLRRRDEEPVRQRGPGRGPRPAGRRAGRTWGGPRRARRPSRRDWRQGWPRPPTRCRRRGPVRRTESPDEVVEGQVAIAGRSAASVTPAIVGSATAARRGEFGRRNGTGTVPAHPFRRPTSMPTRREGDPASAGRMRWSGGARDLVVEAGHRPAPRSVLIGERQPGLRRSRPRTGCAGR